jgi:hypothetical protein
MAIGDYIGDRGQSLAHARLTEIAPNSLSPFFLAHFLGDKCPTFDFLVELVGAGRWRPFFFVQVKATRKGYTKGPPPRLKVSVSAEDVREMVLHPAPTYVVGVDEPGEKAYVIAVFGNMKGPISSLSTRHPLNRPNLQLLWDEVQGYWNSHKRGRKKSRFRN